MHLSAKRPGAAPEPVFLLNWCASGILNGDLKITVLRRRLGAPVLDRRMPLAHEAEEGAGRDVRRLDVVHQMGRAAHVQKVDKTIHKVVLIAGLDPGPFDHHIRCDLVICAVTWAMNFGDE